MASRNSSPADLSALSSNPRATLASWLRLQSTIEAAYKSYPVPYLFSPDIFSVNTFITVARDAIRGAIAFDYPSFIPATDLQAWNSKVIFKPHLGKVYIGPKEKAALASVSAADSATYLSTPSSSPYQFTSLLPEETYAFALLLSRGKILGPVEIASPPPNLNFSPFSNLEHIYKPNGSLVLL